MKKREFGIDAVRILAFCLLLWLHYYLRNGFYYRDAAAAGVWGWLTTSLRPVFMCCVPLFLLLTGYLKFGREWNRKLYLGLVPILVSWILISGIHLAYKILVLKTEMSAAEWVGQFLGFKLANYSWYIGMYIGLILISPIVNLAWNACQEEWQRRGLLLTALAVTTLPATVNHVGHALGIATDLLPGYFNSGYYLTYYMIGGYIRVYRPRVHPALCAGSIAVIAGLLGWVNIVTRTEAASYYKGYYLGYEQLPTVMLAVLLFLLVYRAEIGSERIRQIAERISGVVLEMYLISWIFDTNIYVIGKNAYGMSWYLPVGLLMTGSVFLLAFLSGSLVHRCSVWLSGRITAPFLPGK